MANKSNFEQYPKKNDIFFMDEENEPQNENEVR
jgi:hypothetical protein